MLTECVGDLAGRCNASHISQSVVDNLAVLYVDSVDGAEGTSSRTIVSNELSDNGEWLSRVNNLARTVERLVAKAEGVKVATLKNCHVSISCTGI